MVNCLRAPMASSLPCSSSLPPSLKRHSFRTLCSMNINKFALRPPNPKDLLLPNAAPVAANSPLLLDSQKNSDSLLMTTPGQIKMAAPGMPGKKRRSMRPLDPATDMLYGRRIFIGTPPKAVFVVPKQGHPITILFTELFPSVTQLVVAQLMYLQWSKPKEPIYMFINSTGTTLDDDNSVSSESEGFAIYDMMMMIKNEIYTYCIGKAVGQACLLLAAGTKGKRYIMPHATAMIKQPNAPRLGLMQTSDIGIHTEQAKRNRDTYVELLSRHTRSSIETINNVLRDEPVFYMDPTKAIEFGLVDKIFRTSDEKALSDQVMQKKRRKAKQVFFMDDF